MLWKIYIVVIEIYRVLSCNEKRLKGKIYKKKLYYNFFVIIKVFVFLLFKGIFLNFMILYI